MKSTVEKLEGKVTKITLRLEGGLTVEQDGKWKKYAIAPEMTVSVGSEDDFEEARRRQRHSPNKAGCWTAQARRSLSKRCLSRSRAASGI